MEGDVLRTETDAAGHFRMVGLPKRENNQPYGHGLTILPNVDQPYFVREMTVPISPGLAEVKVDIELHRGIWIEGRVTDHATGKPVVAIINYWPFLSNKFARKFPEYRKTVLEPQLVHASVRNAARWELSNSRSAGTARSSACWSRGTPTRAASALPRFEGWNRTAASART